MAKQKKDPIIEALIEYGQGKMRETPGMKAVILDGRDGQVHHVKPPKRKGKSK